MALFYIVLIIVLAVFHFYKIREYSHYKFLYERVKDVNNILIKVSEDLNDFRDIDALYKELLRDTISLIEGAQTGSILIYNPAKDIMEYKASEGFDFNELKKVRLKKEELFLYKTTKLKSPDIIKNPIIFDSENLTEENFDMLISTKALDIKSTMSAPLYVNGEFYGIINVDNKENENAFSKNDIRLIQYISRHLEIAIKNVLLMNELWIALRIDKLTGIYNRRYFEEIMEEVIKTAETTGRKFSLVMIDMDDFKLINDTYGHKAGDEVLKFFAKVLDESKGENDIVARYAGDEFIMVVYEDDIDRIKERIECMRERLKDCPVKGADASFSAGIYTYEKGFSLDRLVSRADANMYSEKKARKAERAAASD
ncbi:sensor domain-containing diguanylate cyclase [Fonticella tunisiensis]|uniref:Diguanylate cyclase (GGDEF)-like protein n=1 Tax=Fonticella tunisiensis TaxID=1096341 RepID=A0A4R7KS80_9CLOT|nr:sensor domain-containing diguanylate cyclase [Fonticella tunisiensis]TDT62426.1 diguanylate cyclase (GGDEF)-like protein [Fonticella tunisiensis]